MSYCINPTCNYQNISNSCLECQTAPKFCHKCGTKLHIKDKYRLVRPLRDLNKSSHVDVFEVDDNGTLKVLKVLKSYDQTLLRLFKREAEVLKSLRHPGIPKIDVSGYFTVEISITQRELHCLVMEKIDGQDLEQFLQQHGSISQELAIKWLKQLAEILHQVHLKKLFHRDIKPANIMLKPDGQLVLIDFGAARWVSTTVVNGDRDITKVLTRGYGAPEQENGRAVTQSDFFALGRTWVHLLTGRHPRDISHNSPENQFIWREYAPQITSALANFIDELMAREVENRPSDTKEILQHLDNLEPPPPNPSLLRVNQAVFFLCSIILLLIGTVIGIAIGLEIKNPAKVSSTPPKACDLPAIDTSQIAFSPDGKYLAQVSLDKTLRIFDATTLSHETPKQVDCQINSDGIVALKFSPDGRKIATAGLDATALLWTMNPEGKIDSTEKLSHEYSDIPDLKPPVVALDFSHDGNYLASASAEGVVKVWDTNNGQRIESLKLENINYVRAISFSQDKKYLSIVSLNNQAFLWNWQADKKAQKIISLPQNNLIAAAFPGDGKYLATANAAGIAQIWDTTTFEEVARVKLDTYPMAIAFSPKGKHLVTIGLEDDKAEVWNWHTHKNDNLTIPLRHNDDDNLVAVAFPGDQNHVATASTDGTIILWNIDSGDRLKTCNTNKGLVAIALSPQNPNLLATANYDGKINIFECKPK